GRSRFPRAARDATPEAEKPATLHLRNERWTCKAGGRPRVGAVADAQRCCSRIRSKAAVRASSESAQARHLGRASSSRVKLWFFTGAMRLSMHSLQQTIESAWEQRSQLSPAGANAEIRDAVAEAIGELDAGKLRVAEKLNGQWHTHQWLKKAVL